MDSHNFSSETNSIFVVQESSSEDNIKHEFVEVCSDNSAIQLGKGENEVVNSPTSSNTCNVGNDHNYGNMNKTIEVTVKNENITCNDTPNSKENSLDDSGEINVTVTIHDNLICSIKEGNPDVLPASEDGNPLDATVSEDGCQDGKERKSQATLSGSIQAKESVKAENLVSESQMTSDSPRKIFKPISITSVKSLKITKPENFNRNKLFVNPIFCDQDLNNRNIRRSEAWKYFRRLNFQELECNFCKRKISGQSGSSNLLKHLRSQHENEVQFERKLRDESNAEDNCTASSARPANVGYESADKNKVKKISKIWKYFSKSKLGKVKCKICFKIIPYRKSNSMLLRHLRLKHLYIYNCILNRSSKFLKKYCNKKKSTELHVSSSSKSCNKSDVKNNSKELNQNRGTSVQHKVNYPFASSNEVINPNNDKKKRRLSESWKHFTKLQSDKIKCNICDRTLKYIEGVSSNLTRHLKVRHKNIFSKNVDQEFQNVGVEPVADGHQSKMFVIDCVKSNAIQIEDCNDYDDDKNVTKIRKYFSKFNSGQVKCNVCQVILTHTPGMTFNLKCHIILKHKNIFEKIVKAIYVEENENMKIGDNLEMEYKKIKLNWKYFTKMKSGKLKCNLCTEMPSFYCSISESLLHLRLKHNITLDSDEEQSVVSFIELHDKEPHYDEFREGDDSSVKDFEETDRQESLGILKTDRTWKFFSKIYHDKVIEVKCNLCDDVFSYSRGVTSNLTDHLNLVHKDEDFGNDFVRVKTTEELKNVGNNCYERNDSAKRSIFKSHAAKRAICKKSKVWDYFTLTEQSKAKCIICLKVLTFSPRSSSNLSRHLKRRHYNVLNSKNEESTFDHNIEPQKIEPQRASVEEVYDKTSLKSIYEFLKEDLKLKYCIKLESDGIKCIYCLNTFLCKDANSYLKVLQEHMQINHAEWQVVCLENINSRTCREPSDPVSSNYNELEAIANEIQSYSVSKEKVSSENNNENVSNDDLNNSQNDIYKNVWKYFTKLTSQNVRCNFCCTLLLFKNNKKWNLYRHLRLKHKSKLRDDEAFFSKGKSDVKKLESHDSTSQQKKSPDPQVKKGSPQKKNMNPDLSRSLCRKDTNADDSSFTEEEQQQQSNKTNVKPPFTPRTGRTWSHFTKVEMGKATCNVCHKSIHYSGTGLEVLNKHLSKCYGDESATTKKLIPETKELTPPENPSSRLSVTNDQRSKLRTNIGCRRSSRITGGDISSSDKDDEKSCSVKPKTIGSLDSIISGKSDKSISSNYEEDKNDLDYVNNESDVDSEKCESNTVDNQNDKENESVSNSSSVCESTSVGSRNEVCPYFSNIGDGYAKCHLCLLRIPYNDKAVNLVRHLRRIHSVISVRNPIEEQTTKFNENKKEKSQLFAAINLAPNKSVKIQNQVCFTKLGKKTAKCNFCSKIILHKKGDVRKLSNHLLQMHCSEIFSYNDVMLKHVKIFGKSEDISLKPVDLRSANLNQLKSDKDSSDQNDMPNKKRSITWLYYKKLSNDSAQCNICNKALSYKGGSIYNLTRHLFIKHNIKLNRCASLYKQKTGFPIVKTVPKIFNFYKKKNSTLSFYTKINRFFVKCKLCYKHFIYKGVSINRLINHLWSSHIARLIDFNYGTTSSNPHLIESNVQKEISNSQTPMENYIKNTAEVIYQSMSHNIKKNERKRKASNTWKYYTKKLNDGTKAKCNLCLKYFSYKNGNVSNLSRHLLRNHGIKLKKNYQTHKVDKKEIDDDRKGSVNLNLQDANFRDNFLTNYEKDGKGKHPSSFRFTGQVNKSGVTLEKNNDVWKYVKINNGKVECSICEEKIAFQDDKVSESDLRKHLFFKHKIKSLSSVHPLSDGKKVKNKLFLGHRSVNNKNKKLKSSFTRMKCKLCNRLLILKDYEAEKLIKHLKIHEKELSKGESILLNKFLNSKDKFSNSDIGNENDSECSGNVKSSVNQMVLLKHFKNLDSLKNRCKICHKFVSSKIYCTHHITNDLSITYGIKRNRSLRNGVFVNSNDKPVDSDSIKLLRQKRWGNFTADVKVKHFMNVNSYENKCGSCNLSLKSKGYCSHSLNQWLNEKQLEESEYPSASDGNKMKDELEIITDALSDGENKIIIITDDGAPSILNYDGCTKNGTESNDDVSYHVIDMDGENNDDIQVVIYNFDPEESEKSIHQQADGAKIEELKDSAGGNQTCDKALEEQVKVILQELNNANVFSNQVQRKCKNMVNIEEKSSVAESVNHQSDVLPEKEIVSEEKPLKQILEDSSSKKKVEVQPIPISATLSEDLAKQEISDHSTKIPISKLEQSESFKPTQKIEELSDEIVISSDLSEESSVVQKGIDESNCESVHVEYNDMSKNVIETDQPKETELQVVKVADENSSISENTFDGSNKRNFDEAVVNFEESAAEFNSIDTYKNDDIEISSGMFLQNLNGLHKINKNLIYFSNIDYMYNTAKCNICNSNLIFNNPLIYNLMAHLFLIHKKRMIPTNSLLDVTHDKNGKKILDLLKCNTDNVYTEKPVVKPRRKSLVWKYFINDTDCRATCKICHFNFSYKGGAVNNLGRHLRLRHNVHISTKNGEGDVINFENYDEADLNEFKLYPMLPKKRSYVKLRSKTWNYFSKEPNDWAKCILCKRYLSYRSSTINNLTRHLRTVHADIYSCLFAEKEISCDDGTGSNEVMNDDIFKNVLLETTASRSRDEVLQECWYTASEQSSTKRTSVVWNYFNEVNRDSGRCNFCSKLISCKGGGTSNLSRHLRVKHGIWIVLTSTLAKKYEEQFSNDIGSNQTDFFLNQNSDPSLTPNDKIITHEELHYLKNKKPESKKSKTWDYFIKESPDKVVCKVCSKVLSYKCKAVHNLRRHLAIKHPDCLGKREPVRLKLQIDNEKDTYEGENDPIVSDKKYIDITNTSVVIVDEEIPPPMRKTDRCSRPKKSLVWNYFDELEYGVAKCNLCSKVLSFRGGGTNNLMRHLRSQHAIIIDLQVAEDSGFLLTSNDNDSNGGDVNSNSGNFILGN